MYIEMMMTPTMSPTPSIMIGSTIEVSDCTEAATSVESVREKRAIVIFSTVSPMRIGNFSFIVSHFLRPLSVFFQRKKAQMVNGMMRIRYGLWRRRFDTLTTYAVKVGSWPFND